MYSSPSHVLIIEDNDDDVFLTQHAFERAGLECFWQVAADGEEAISYLSGEGAFADREVYSLPMVVLLDLKLPRKSGYEVLAWMREQKALDEVIRVVLTGSNNPADVDRSYALGAHGYLFKPITDDQLNMSGRSLMRVLLQGRAPRPAPLLA
jgi:CheY-like chemotaxis protein